MKATKVCFKCRKELPITVFYRHPKMADGRQSNCKACLLEYTQARYRRKREAILDYMRRMPAPERNARAAAMRELHPEKYRARVAVSAAIASGKLKKQPCERCGEPKVHAHHEDYSKPLEVRWLCTKHHGEVHRANRLALIGETA